jgi:lipopolysaccharide export system permease protein
MFGTIIHRSIFFELMKNFILALVSLTGMFLIAGLIQEASKSGLGVVQIIMAIPLFVPSTLPFTVPATTLFATCVVYGRMSADNEVIVLKAAGVNILTLLWPAILLGTMTTSAVFFLYRDTIPRTQQLMREKIINEAEDVLYSSLKRDRALRQANMPYVIFVKEVQGKRLIDVIFKQRHRENDNWVGYEMIARGREARLSVNLQEKKIEVIIENCSVYGDKADLYGNGGTQKFSVDLPEAIFGKDPKFRPSSLMWDELLVREGEVRKEVEEKRIDRENAVKQLEATPSDSPLYQPRKLEVLHRENILKEFERLYRVILVEQQYRPALAVGCLCFVLIGCPVGIWASRADYLSIFVICFMPTLFVYYPLLLAGTNLGKDGKVPIPPVIWAADAILGSIAIWLIWKLMRR